MKIEFVKPVITDHDHIMIGITIIGLIVFGLIFLSILRTASVI